MNFYKNLITWSGQSMALRKVASLCEQLGPVSIYLLPKCIKLWFQNLSNCYEQIKTDVGRLLLILIVKENYSIDFSKIGHFTDTIEFQGSNYHSVYEPPNWISG